MTGGGEFQKVTHVIFDMDGLLLDTETLYTQAAQTILDDYGKTYTWDVKASLMGQHNEQVAKIIVNSYNLPLSWQEYSERQRAIAKKIMLDAELMPGAERLLRHLHANNIPIALATSSSEEMVHVKIHHHKELFDLFNHKVTGTDPMVKEGKPAPDVFLAAAARFTDKPDTSKCLVFEDAPNGVRAARAAGMQVVIVPDPNTPKELYENDATLVLSSLNDFKPELFGLPPFQD